MSQYVALKKPFLSLALILSCGFLLLAGRQINGAVHLDIPTFFKILPNQRFTLLKVDSDGAYGKKVDEFEKVAEASANIPELLVALVEISEYYEITNQELADRYRVEKEDFPALFLFRNGSVDNAISYFGPIQAEMILRWLRGNGVHFHLPGCLPEFDIMAAQFKAATSNNERQEVLDRAQEAAELVKDGYIRDAANLYIQVMKRVLKLGPSIVHFDMQQLTQMAQKADSTDPDLQKLNMQLNILSSFLRLDRENT
ncbi:endoplasmic reticulum resident protein 29-like [Protopterus annectens]|uniref:endoplasmic reticulum resident protein 29-like n=1 Tax=Protopterus annectens TaxID=7888 RepID=UPI001CFB3587|nr:endoplasmic reticulum resident protein 29-like [Protopterus annectens]